MLRGQHLRAAVTLVLAATCIATAHAETRAAGISLYVSPSGDDGNPGTQNRPFKTITKAAATATQNTTVHVAPGHYAGDVTTKRAGTANAWIDYVSDTPGGAVINGLVNLNTEYVRFGGFEITDPKERDGMNVTASNIVVQGNIFHDIHKMKPNSDGGSALTVDTANDDHSALHDITVDRNRVYDIGQGVGTDDELVQGIYISIPCKGCAVTNNIVYDVADFGIHSYHNPQFWTVANNTVFHNGRGILIGKSFTVVNNISYGNKSSNYDIRGSQDVTHNLSFGSGAQTLDGIEVADPQFVDYKADGTGDYHLRPGSPGIDTGTPTGAPTLDYAGTPRPQGHGYGIGAYEQ